MRTAAILDPDDEIPRTLSEAARMCPRRPHSSTVWRWCRRGITARTGERIRLRHIRAGACIFTTQADLVHFFRSLAEADVTYFEQERAAKERVAQAGL